MRKVTITDKSGGPEIIEVEERLGYWKVGNLETTLPASTSTADFSREGSSSPLPWWDDATLKAHIEKHADKTWFKGLYGEGPKAVEAYRKQAIAFIRTPPTENEIRRYRIRCDNNQHGENDILLYCMRANMIGIAHESNRYIHTMFSPRNGQGEVEKILDKRLLQEENKDD